MIYLLQIIIYSSVLWLVYSLILRDRPMHAFNRAYLLLASVAPLLLPAAKLPTGLATESYRTDYLHFRLPEITITGGSIPPDLLKAEWWLVIGYIIITGALLILHLRHWWQLRSVIGKNEKAKNAEFTLLVNTGYGPGSWGRYIFFPHGDVDERILMHEQAHIRLHHTADTIWMLLLFTFCWFNPFFWLIRRELRMIHEYQADNLAADKAAYSELLLTQALGIYALPLAHSFFNHPIKRRIMMLHKNLRKTSAIVRGSLAAICTLSFLAAVTTLQSCKTQPLEISERPQEKTMIVRAANGEGDTVRFENVTLSEIYESAARMPQYPGGETALVDFMARALKYPDAARKAGVQGKVLVKFYVDPGGNVRWPEIVSSPDTLLSTAALDAIRKMPRWTAGENEKGAKIPVYFTLPVLFRL